jgi:Resolvase, N terminal domain
VPAVPSDRTLVFSLAASYKSASGTGVPKMRNAAVYLRASTQHGSAVDQEQALREVANRLGCEIVKVYRDDESSGAKRPQLENLRWDGRPEERRGRQSQAITGRRPRLRTIPMELGPR